MDIIDSLSGVEKELKLILYLFIALVTYSRRKAR